MRRVLNHAFSDFISDEMLDAASAALEMGYEGSLSRHAAGPRNTCTHVMQNGLLSNRARHACHLKALQKCYLQHGRGLHASALPGCSPPVLKTTADSWSLASGCAWSGGGPQ